jgi:hypothetical protein
MSEGASFIRSYLIIELDVNNAFLQSYLQDSMRTPSNLNFWFKKQTKNLETAVADSGLCIKYGAAFSMSFVQL